MHCIQQLQGAGLLIVAFTGPTVVRSMLQCSPADIKHESQSSVQDDKSQRSGRRSEADSEEANQDVSALSQEGSLGSFSDSSFKLRMAAAAESVPATYHVPHTHLQVHVGKQWQLFCSFAAPLSMRHTCQDTHAASHRVGHLSVQGTHQVCRIACH